jgi:hypothetical protein
MEKKEKRILTEDEKNELLRRKRNKKILERSGNIVLLMLT